MAEAAVICDVDGVLLELTNAEEELFFHPFASRCDASQLSRDWNSYRVRNDEDIIAELVERHQLPHNSAAPIKAEYLAVLHHHLQHNIIKTKQIPGAKSLLQACSAFATLGIATANLRKAAQLRLQQAALWEFVSAHAHGADGGGHKHQIFGRALAQLNMPKSRVVYIGDNVNDVQAGLEHRVHFIGFSQDHNRLKILKTAGAEYLSSHHTETLAMIKTLLGS